MVILTAFQFWLDYLIHLPALCGGEGFSFQGCVPPDDIVDSESVVGVKPGISCVVFGCQGDEFSHTWLVECFIAWSCIDPGFMGKVSALTHFPLEPGCKDYSFLDQAVTDFKHGFDSILMNSSNTPELDASFDEADAMPSSVSSGFLCFVSTSDKSQPHFLLASNLINCGASIGFYFCLYQRWVQYQHPS